MKQFFNGFHFRQGSIRVLFEIKFNIIVIITTDTSKPNLDPVEEVKTILSQPVIEQLIDMAEFTKAGTLHFSGNSHQLSLVLFEIKYKSFFRSNLTSLL